MMNKIIIIISCCLVLVIGIVGAIIFFGKSKPEKDNAYVNGTLYVNGKKITNENVKIFSNYVDLPLTEVMKGVGIDVDWVNDSTAEITCNGQKYILNLAEATLTEYGDDYNLIKPAPGSTSFHYKVLEKEVVTDENTIKCILFLMKNQIYTNIDRDNSKVYVTERKD